jgi:methionine-R-sulfoxide reductase
VGAAEYAHPNTGARITRRNSANGALLIRAPNTAKTKNSGASAPCEVFSAQMNNEVLTKKSPPMNSLRVSYSRGSRKSLWSAFIATVIVIIGLVFWSYTQGQRKLAMKANPNKSVPNDTELRTRLGKHQYRVTREGATETPFQNAYWDNHQPGIYVDIITGEPLFSSLDKFDSGTGWPSFTKPISKDKVVEKSDSSLEWIGLKFAQAKAIRTLTRNQLCESAIQSHETMPPRDRVGQTPPKKFEARFFNDQVLLLDHKFVHRLTAIAGKDGNPLNRLRTN